MCPKLRLVLLCEFIDRVVTESHQVFFFLTHLFSSSGRVFYNGWKDFLVLGGESIELTFIVTGGSPTGSLSYRVF